MNPWLKPILLDLAKLFLPPGEGNFKNHNEKKTEVKTSKNFESILKTMFVDLNYS